MHAIIPVAGFGTRLRPHTFSVPKVLLSVAGKPIIAHIVDQLLDDGVTSATIIVGHLGEAIEKFMRGRYPSLPMNFIEQKELLGLGHAIWIARDDIPKDGSPLFIVLGDTIFDVDLKSVFQTPTSAIGTFYVEDPRRFGVVESEGGFATRLVEKPEHPKTNMMIAGLYFFRNPALLHECLDDLVTGQRKTRNEFQLTDALQAMIERGEKFVTFPLKGWFDCGKPDTLLSTNRALLEKKSQSRPLTRTIIQEPVFISETSDIEDSIIGPYATIGAGTRIRNAIVRDSIVGDNAIVEHTLLEKSILGDNTIVKGTFKQINAGNSSEIDL